MRLILSTHARDEYPGGLIRRTFLDFVISWLFLWLGLVYYNCLFFDGPVLFSWGGGCKAYKLQYVYESS